MFKILSAIRMIKQSISNLTSAFSEHTIALKTMQLTVDDQQLQIDGFRRGMNRLLESSAFCGTVQREVVALMKLQVIDEDEPDDPSTEPPTRAERDFVEWATRVRKACLVDLKPEDVIVCQWVEDQPVRIRMQTREPVHAQLLRNWLVLMLGTNDLSYGEYGGGEWISVDFGGLHFKGWAPPASHLKLVLTDSEKQDRIRFMSGYIRAETAMSPDTFTVEIEGHAFIIGATSHGRRNTIRRWLLDQGIDARHIRVADEWHLAVRMQDALKKLPNRERDTVTINRDTLHLVMSKLAPNATAEQIDASINSMGKV